MHRLPWNSDAVRRHISSLLGALEGLVPEAHPPNGGDEWVSIRARYPYDISRVLFLRMSGMRVVDGEPRFRPQKVWPFVVVIVAPLLVAVIQGLYGQVPNDRLGEYAFWQMYFFTSDILIVLVVRFMVALFYHTTKLFPDVLTENGVAEYHDWADSSLRLVPQVLSGLILGVIGCSVLAGLSVLGNNSRVYLDFSSFISVFVTSFLAGTCAFWIVNGTLLLRRWHLGGMLRLWHFFPAETPGIVALSRVYSWCFLGVSMFTAILMFSAVYYAQGIALDAGHSMRVLTKDIFLVIPAAVSCGSALFIGILPQLWLSQRIEEQRAVAIGEFEKEIEGIFTPKALTKRIDWQVLASLLDSPKSSLRASGFISFLGAVVAGILPYVGHAVFGVLA